MLSAKDILQLPYEYGLDTINLDKHYDSSSVKRLQLNSRIGLRIPQYSEANDTTNKCAALLEGKSLKGNYISVTDRKKGYEWETLFEQKVLQHGLTVNRVPYFSHNYLKHIDFELVDKYNKSCFVDIKSPKALRKASKYSTKLEDPLTRPQNTYVCLELNSTGSLFGSESDYIVFSQTDNSFLFCNRIKLIEIVKQKLNSQIRSAWPETALWIPYVRSFNDVHTVMTYMDLNDLHPCIEFKLM